jgi:DNA polymerase-3 subunit epsilon
MNNYICCIDTETTGLDGQKDFIIQLSLIKFRKDNFEQVLERNWYILPQHKFSISPGAQQAHGISDEFIRENGVSIRSIADEFLDIIKDCDFLTYNGNNFDFKFITKDFRLAGYDVPLDDKLFYDSFGMEVRKTPRNLGAVYKRYTGKDLEGAHDALNDVRATIEVFKYQLMEVEDTYDTINEWNENRLFAPEGFIRDAAAPGEPTRIVFYTGKYSGSDFLQVCKDDPSYIKWYMENIASNYTKKKLKSYYALHRS